MKVLMSYPRSGNHLVRFFIELLSEQPTFGCMTNKEDISIYKNSFAEEIPFNISVYNKSQCYYKFHNIPKYSTDKLIFIIRNPREVLIRQNGSVQVKLSGFANYNTYFDTLDYYLNSKCDKLLLFYEDIITNKTGFIQQLYDFLELDNPEKLAYVLENIEKLYDLSASGGKRAWGGFNSNYKLNYYYNDDLPPKFKEQFDDYINKKMQNPDYKFIKNRYCL